MIRKTIIVGIATSAVLTIAAGEYLPVLQKGRTWKTLGIPTGDYIAGFDNGNPYEHFIARTHCIEGDTIVGGVYGMVVVSKDDSSVFEDRYNVVFEENGLLYSNITDEMKEYNFYYVYGYDMFSPRLVAMNIGMEVGDEYYQKYHVSITDSIKVNGVVRRRVRFRYKSNQDESHVEDKYALIWVEGIGYYSDFASLYKGNHQRIMVNLTTHCYQDNELIFTGLDFNAPTYSPNYDYLPLLSEDKVWEYVVTPTIGDTDKKWFYRIMLTDTKEVEGATYRKVEVHDCSEELIGVNVNGKIISPGASLGWVREDDGKVYLLMDEGDALCYDFYDKESMLPSAAGDIILYDFTANRGNVVTSIFHDTKTGHIISPMKFTDRSISKTSGEARATYTASSLWAEYDALLSDHVPILDYTDPYLSQLSLVTFVEGVGNVGEGNLVDVRVQSESLASEERQYRETLNNLYSVTGEILYRGKGYDSNAEMKGLQTDESWQKAIYNLGGQRLREAPKGEPYIENGRKKIGR